MTAITVANTEYEIIDDLSDAVTDATIDDAAVFQVVDLSTSEDQAREVQLKGETPRCIILYQGSTQDTAPEDLLNCVLSVTFFIATKSTGTQAVKLREILRLVNAVKNAVSSDPPADAHTVAHQDFYHEKFVWTDPTIDTTEKDPWVAAMLPLEVGFSLDSSTSH